MGNVRDDAPEQYSSLDYNATLKRMEEGLAPMDPGIALASIAVSLVRAVDLLSQIHNEMVMDKYEQRQNTMSIQSAISAIQFAHNRST